MTLDADAIRAVVEGRHGDPFAVLGPHRVQTPDGAAVAVRAIMPGAAAVRIVPTDAPPTSMARLHPVGFFEAVLSDRPDLFAYRLEVTRNGQVTEIDDPYRFQSLLSDFDRHLLAEGTHHHAHEKLGAHPVIIDGVPGVAFGVWAPSARRVSVVGDFNDWDGRCHPMRLHPANGIWEIFVPGLGQDERYKFEIRGRDRGAARTEIRPLCARLRGGDAAHGVGRGESRRLPVERRGLAAPSGPDARCFASRCRSTKCISVRGGACPSRAIASSTIASWRTSSRTTSSRWASRTSSSCP